MTQTACPRLKCPGLLIFRGETYECVYCHTHYPVAQIDEMEALPLSALDDPDEQPLSRKDDRRKSRRDGADLIAAALGLKSSAWAQAEVHLTDAEFNFAIHGEPVSGPDMPDPDEGAQS